MYTMKQRCEKSTGFSSLPLTDIYGKPCSHSLNQDRCRGFCKSEKHNGKPINQAINDACGYTIYNHRARNREHLCANTKDKSFCVCPVRTHKFAKKTLQKIIDKCTWQYYTNLANKTWQRSLHL